MKALSFIKLLSVFLLVTTPAHAYKVKSTEIRVNASSWTGNLAPSDTDLQKALDRLDRVVTGGAAINIDGGNALSVYLVNQNLSGGSASTEGGEVLQGGGSDGS